MRELVFHSNDFSYVAASFSLSLAATRLRSLAAYAIFFFEGCLKK